MSEAMTYSELCLRRRQHAMYDPRAFDPGTLDRVEIALLDRERLLEERAGLIEKIDDLHAEIHRVFLEKVAGQ